MLVLARRSGDSIIIGDDIEITVIEVQGDKVKLGIKAPKKVPVMRRELLDEAKSANKEAASPNVDLKLLKNFLNQK
ncbi:MAG TPA: carbon storage regulator CsrA [Ruminiclostridium sp.]|nr:carbon storage regulator CsrA [Ruminiclostridium sp.]